MEVGFCGIISLLLLRIQPNVQLLNPSLAETKRAHSSKPCAFSFCSSFKGKCILLKESPFTRMGLRNGLYNIASGSKFMNIFQAAILNIVFQQQGSLLSLN